MKLIPLTQGQFAKVSDHRFEYLNQWKWHAQWNPKLKSYYAARKDGKFPFRKEIRMHRQIMNTPKDMVTDHINHDTLDNQDHNLRNVTPSQNMMNRRGENIDNKLGERCITRHQKGFRVRVHKEGKKVFDKMFSTLEAAVVGRNEALKKHHGEFSNEL